MGPWSSDYQMDLVSSIPSALHFFLFAVSSSGRPNQAAPSGVESSEAAPHVVRTAKVCDHCGERASEGKKLLRCSDCRKVSRLISV